MDTDPERDTLAGGGISRFLFFQDEFGIKTGMFARIKHRLCFTVPDDGAFRLRSFPVNCAERTDFNLDVFQWFHPRNDYSLETFVFIGCHFKFCFSEIEFRTGPCEKNRSHGIGGSDSVAESGCGKCGASVVLAQLSQCLLTDVPGIGKKTGGVIVTERVASNRSIGIVQLLLQGFRVFSFRRIQALTLENVKT